MKKRLLISPKKDWISKCKGRIDEEKFSVDYIEIEKVKNFNKYDAIIPLYEHDSRYLNQNKNRLKNQKFLIPSNELIAICEDKKKFYDVLGLHGFSHVTPEISPLLEPPYILKKKVDEFGKNSFIVKSLDDEQKYEEQLRSSDYFKQNYVFGKKEFTFHFLMVNGKIKYDHSLCFFFNLDTYVRGAQMPAFGNATITSIESEYISLFEELLQKIGYDGVGCINYKLKNGKPLIFEINPRVGGSLPLDVDAFLTSYCSSMTPSWKTKLLKKVLS